MRKLKRLLRDRKGEMFPLTVAVTIVLMLLILVVSEYMRLMITASGVKDAYESAIISVVNDNYNEVYHCVREGYAAGYQPTDSGFYASIDAGDVEGRLCYLLGVQEDGDVLVKYNNETETEYRISDLQVEVFNASMQRDGGEFYAEGALTLEVPVRFAGKIVGRLPIRLRARARMTEVF